MNIAAICTLSKKTYELAKPKYHAGEESSFSKEPECTVASALARSIHSASSKFETKSQCVICNKTYDREEKLPKSKVATENCQSLLTKAYSLQDYVMLQRIQDYSNETIDMVASDICYHMLCMNKYMAQSKGLDFV